VEREVLKDLIDVAAGRKPADLCIRNCKVIDVFNKEIFESDVYVTNGLIAGFGPKADEIADFPKALEEYDAKGRYLAPGFIDSHVHIESSHVSPAEFSKLVVPHGTTTVIADPHEICNVCGLDGIDYMLAASENIALQVFLQFPSCVPATPFENAGAVLGPREIHSRINNPRILGLGELMNFVGTCAGDDEIIDKIMEAKNAGKVVDGHSPNLHGYMLDAYAASGVCTDHECATPEELRDRTRRGVYVLLRQGTACHDVLNLLPGVDSKNEELCLFCTDDRQASSLVNEGHIDNNIRLALGKGFDLITAICMASLNAARCFNLRDRGAVSPGLRADLILFENSSRLKIDEVWIGGKHVASEGVYLAEDEHIKPRNVSGKMNVKNFSEDRLKLKLKSDLVRTIKIIPHSVVTEQGTAKIQRDIEGNWVRDDQDICKIAVVERHKGTGNVGIGLLENFGLKNGAIATSVAHDSHNIIVCGDNDKDMAIAVEKLIEMGGGIAVVKNGEVLDSFAHEIAGLMTDQSGEFVSERLYEMEMLARKQLHIHPHSDPFMTLCFMALPVIPEIKITDMGIFNAEQFRLVPVEII